MLEYGQMEGKWTVMLKQFMIVFVIISIISFIFWPPLGPCDILALADIDITQVKDLSCLEISK